MEHGQIIRFDKDYDNCPYITIKYRGQYLFLSTQTLNRRDDFVEFVKDKYEDTGVNILDVIPKVRPPIIASIVGPKIISTHI